MEDKDQQFIFQNKIEQNYEIHNKEILVIRGLKSQKHLLEGAKFKFKIQTNYETLKYFIKMQKLNQKQAR